MTSGGWKGSDRRSRLPADWPRLKAAVRARSGGRCEVIEPSKKDGRPVRCWRKARDCDHIVRGDDHSLANLRDICAYHHGKKSAQEGVEARRTGSVARQPERHPGDRS